MNFETRVIIQARVGSKRLPNKTVLKLGNLSLIEWIILRLRQDFPAQNICLAIPNTKENNPLEEIAKLHAITSIRGPENDVLSRYLMASKSLEDEDYIIRVCADNPFISGKLLKAMMTYAQQKKLPFVHTLSKPPEFPYIDGLGAEIFTVATLLKIGEQSATPFTREHVTVSAYNRDSEISVQGMPTPDKYNNSNLRLDIDTLEDYLRINTAVVKFSITPMTSDEEIISIFTRELFQQKNKFQ